MPVSNAKKPLPTSVKPMRQMRFLFVLTCSLVVVAIFSVVMLSHDILDPPSQTLRNETSAIAATTPGSSTQRGTLTDWSRIKPCAKALIFTGARQGSTWFIDSIEKCSYSHIDPTTEHRLFARDVFRRTELWKHFGEPHLDGTNMTAHDALHYVARNTSVKIFPSVFWRRRDDIITMLKHRHEFRLAVLVLRRDVNAAWLSWLKAMASNNWAGAATSTNILRNSTADSTAAQGKPEGQTVREDAKGYNHELARDLFERAQQVHPTASISKSRYDDHYRYFIESRRSYDRGVERLLRDLNVPYDVMDYGKLHNVPAILARNNRCWIPNCNFRKREQREAFQALKELETQSLSGAAHVTNYADTSSADLSGTKNISHDRVQTMETSAEKEAGAGKDVNDAINL